jgi:acyl phosphate:glycerol-3-phosphate acyltransferase
MVEAGAIVGSYLAGSIPFGLLVGKLKGVDIRTVGSKNIGATNVARTLGKPFGALVLLLDALKGLLPTLAARHLLLLDGNFVALVGMAAILGHVFPVWLRFRGGKGVATASGAFGVLAPMAAAAALAVFIAVVWSTRLVSLGSLAATLALVGTAAWHEPTLVKEATAAVAAVIVLKHHANITRLRAGTERSLAI